MSRAWALYVSACLIAGGLFFVIGVTAVMRGDMNGAVVAGLSFPLMVLGGVALHSSAERPFRPHVYNDRAQVEVDWYLSDVRATFVCPCDDATAHRVAGYTMGGVRCPTCKKTYRIVTVLPAYARDKETVTT